MGTFLDRTGIQYGRLTVLANKGKDENGHYLWKCICSCGNTKVVTSNNLSSGKSQSCGCLKIEALRKVQYKPAKDRESTILKHQYSHVVKRHNKKEMIGEVMSLSTFKILSTSNCEYCGQEPERVIEDRSCYSKSTKKILGHSIKINGIDRVDNSIGYTYENSAPCCSRCNFAKHTMSRGDFLQWIQKVYDFNFK